MLATFYNIKKERNSTALPSDGESVEIYLKDECSIINPTIRIKKDVKKFNYMYIEPFKRYYFIDSITFGVDKLYIIKGSVDVLATYRESILSSSQYVERANTGYDINIIDNVYPAKAGRKTNIQYHDLLGTSEDFPSGTFIIGVAGSQSSYCGTPVTYYMLDIGNMSKLTDFLFNAGSYGELFQDDVMKAFYNPLDWIVSCMYFPVKIFQPPSGGGIVDIDFGFFSTSGIEARLLSGFNTLKNAEFNIFKPSNGYLNAPPWCMYDIFIPFVGKIDLPSDIMFNCDKLAVSLTIDLITGSIDAELRFKSGDVNKYHINAGGQCGSPISLAQVRYDIIGAVQQVSGGVGSLLTGNIGGMIGGAVSAIDAMTPDPDVKFKTGAIGLCFANRDIRFTCTYFETAELNTKRLGRPVCAERTLSDFNGFVKCNNGSVELENAFFDEISIVNNFLNGGVYIE